MRGSAAKTLAKLRRGGSRGEDTAEQGMHRELLARTQQLFGPFAVVDQVQTDYAGRPRSFAVTFDVATASALAAPQRMRQAEWQLRNIVDPGGNGLVTATWDLPRRIVRVAATTLPQCVPAAPRGAAANDLDDAMKAYATLDIPIGLGENGREVVWPLHKAAHCVIAQREAGAGLSTMLRTISTAAAHAGMCVVVADLTVEEHDDFAGFLDWPNMHLVGRDQRGAVRAVSYVADILERREQRARGEAVSGTEGGVPDGAPILLVVHGFDTLARSEPGEAVVERLRQTVTWIGSLGRAHRVHVVLTFQRGRVAREVNWLAEMSVQLGRLDPLVPSVLGITSQLATRGRGLARLGNEDTLLQGYYTPDPVWNRSDADTAILDALRPPRSLYPRMVVASSPTADGASEILSAPVVTADSRPDLDPLSAHYRPQPPRAPLW